MATGFTRREFARTAGSVVLATATIPGSGPLAAQAKLTAANVVDRIKTKLAQRERFGDPRRSTAFTSAIHRLR